MRYPFRMPDYQALGITATWNIPVPAGPQRKWPLAAKPTAGFRARVVRNRRCIASGRA